MSGVWMIASDIHGDAQTTKLLLEAYAESGAERLILLGDVLYHGPRNDLPQGYAPKEVIRLLNGIKESILCVRGNCDAEVDQMVLDFPILSDTAQLSADGVRVIAHHGHHALPPLPAGCVVLSGHTHVPVAKRCEGYVHINPGSVSLPKEDSPKSYVLYSDGSFSFRQLADGREYMRLSLREE